MVERLDSVLVNVKNSIQWGAFAAYMLLCLALAYSGGMDLNWDLFNYHLYTPALLLGRPLGQDFMGASIQSYLNGLPNLPFYLMVKAGWPALLIGSVLAVAHSLNMIILHLIAAELIPECTPRRQLLCIFAALLGAAAPQFWIEVGASFVDVLVSVPILMAILLLLKLSNLENNSSGNILVTRYVLWAGVGLGAALGLKLTNIPWAPALGLALLLTVRGHNFKLSILFVAAAMISFLCVAGYWMWKLWVQFGNPFFPFFNEIFHSPEAASGALVHERFTPKSWVDVFWFPLRMMQLPSTVYSEVFAADGRLAALILFSGAWGLVRLLGKRHHVEKASRAMCVAMVLALVYFSLWFALSGNGRYAMPWLLLLGPLILAVIVRVSSNRLWLTYASVLVLSLQTTANCLGGMQRWGESPWAEQWMMVKMPEILQSEPHLFLSLQTQSYSALSMFVHERSGFVNLIGQDTLAPGAAGWGRVERLINQYHGKIRTLHVATDMSDAANEHVNWSQRSKDILLPYYLTTDESSCLEIKVPGGVQEAMNGWRVVGNGLKKTIRTRLVSCAVRGMTDEEKEKARKVSNAVMYASAVFDEIEKKCSNLTGKRSTSTFYTGASYQRHYVNKDNYLSISSKKGKVTVQGFSGMMREIPSDCFDPGNVKSVIQTFVGVG